MAEGDTLTNSLIGAVLIVLTTPVIPFAPLAGGIVAGYLQGRDPDAGIKVGAIAGGLSLVPLLALFALLGNLFLFVLTLGGVGVPTVVGGFGIAILFSVFVGLLFYVVLLSAVGGWIGSYLKRERIV